jgi:hypothetical protein
MISAWWLVGAFVAGGYAGILVMALLYFASDEREAQRRLTIDS